MCCLLSCVLHDSDTFSEASTIAMKLYEEDVCTKIISAVLEIADFREALIISEESIRV